MLETTKMMQSYIKCDIGEVARQLAAAKPSRTIQDFNLMVIEHNDWEFMATFIRHDLPEYDKSGKVAYAMDELEVFRRDEEDYGSDIKVSETIRKLDCGGTKMRVRVVLPSNRRGPKTDLLDHTKISRIFDDIEERQKAYFIDQKQLPEEKIVDRRIHCCFYCIDNKESKAKRFSPKEVKFIRKLQRRVNIIFVFVPRRWLTEEGIERMAPLRIWFKEMSRKHGIKGYQFKHHADESADIHRLIELANERQAFWLGPRSTFLRNNQWHNRFSIVEPEVIADREDFFLLWNLLLRHCALDLVESTPTYRYKVLLSLKLAFKGLIGPQGKIQQSLATREKQPDDAHEFQTIDKKLMLDRLPRR